MDGSSNGEKVKKTCLGSVKLSRSIVYEHFCPSSQKVRFQSFRSSESTVKRHLALLPLPLLDLL